MHPTEPQALTQAAVRARRSLLPPEALQGDPSDSLPRHFRLVVAVNKSDLLPNQVTPHRLEVRLERWAGLGWTGLAGLGCGVTGFGRSSGGMRWELFKGNCYCFLA